MDIIRSNLGSINVPSESTKIYKDECVFSYDTPVRILFCFTWSYFSSYSLVIELCVLIFLLSKESKEGLFICMNTFLGFGAEFVPLHYQRTGYRIFLNVKKIKRQVWLSRYVEFFFPTGLFVVTGRYWWIRRWYYLFCQENY